ncbi:hypothetical protein CONPUDRAFT_83555 [Coniophora puteana RWD-64-598 SS2]|uniref:Carbohydrate-binding module family 19 domain-containing protein n=1 Tax=Coniophora puteana (strain RWD-64-598) TaxID=741705 RepID=A0A5M3MJK4_CONPW|nr:uncharacterized protein CONPUDRAFT_83555 [Coniophora puteana RWD-64-598 SS2]EIW79293.1 hypothetical protein CONPUDRAFT_83555 [Coniophora puteana RWD-64-598 SS2]
MRFASLTTLACGAVFVQSAPLRQHKRIAQVISDSTTKWEAACDAAGGGSQCNTISVNAFGTLLAAPPACAQQDAADQMIDLAKQLNNNADMISLAQIFAQQPRNSPTSQAVPYCQSAPKNAELNGLFQCQFQGADEKTFVGGVAVGGNGTIPFGMSSPVSPAGSCSANPSGPIPDGQQLVDITQNPGASSTGGSSGSGSNSTSTGSSSSGSSDTSATATATGAAGASTSAVSSTATGSTGSSSASDPSSTGSSTVGTGSSGNTTGSTSGSEGGSSSFLLSNGQEAQKQNAQFASLTSSSSCTEGENACVQGSFAQCVNGKFETTSCGSGLTCAALPLVNSQGTSITCTTTADAAARIAATGAQGGIDGSGSSNATGTATGSASGSIGTTTAANPASSGAVAVSTGNTSDSQSFLLSNGQGAQKQNAQFASLTTSSSCTEGENACVQGSFAQCVDGNFETSSCGSGLTCAALPLVNSQGTSVTCTTTADAASRIAATGAQGGIDGTGSSS